MRSKPGFALIISMLILLVSTLIGVSAINIAGLEIDLAGAKRQKGQLSSCADAARNLVQSMFQFGTDLTGVTLNYTYPGGLTASTGHYGSTASIKTVQQADSTSFSSAASQTANIVNGMRKGGAGLGQFYRVTVVCTATDPFGRLNQRELEFMVMYSL